MPVLLYNIQQINLIRNYSIELITLDFVIILLVVTFAPIIARYTHMQVIVIELIIGILLGKSLFDIIPSGGKAFLWGLYNQQNSVL